MNRVSLKMIVSAWYCKV